MYRLRIFDLEGKILVSANFTMKELIGRIAEAMPEDVQSNATISNSLMNRGFYSRGGLDVMGLPVIAVVTNLPK